MITRTNLFSVVIAATSLSALPSSASAATYHHIDTIAVRIARESAELFREFRIHYRHTAEYPHLISDARELRNHARHIHDVAHRNGSLLHLANDLREIDRLFHHIEELVRRTERSARCDYRSGHIHGETSHVASLMRAIENDIHHLRSDIDEMLPHARAPHPSRRRAISVPAPYVGQRGYRGPPQAPFGLPFPAGRMVFRFGH